MNHLPLDEARQLAAALQLAILASGRTDLLARRTSASIVLESGTDAVTIRVGRRMARKGPARTEFVELAADGSPELIAYSVETAVMLTLERFGVQVG